MNITATIISCAVTTVVGAIIGGAISTIIAKAKARQAKLTAQDRAMICLLRAELIRLCNSITANNYMTQDEAEELQELYESYHDGYHANGVGTRMYETAMEKPIRR